MLYVCGHQLTFGVVDAKLYPDVRPGKPAQHAWEVNGSADELSNHSYKLLTEPPSYNTTAQQTACHSDATASPNLPSAITHIFHYLECGSGVSLARTCCACASEFALQKKAFLTKRLVELTPILSLDEADCHPVGIHAWWSSTSTMRRLYALRRDPDFLQQIWQRAWPADVRSELQANGLPAFVYHTVIRVQILVENETDLTVPWDWLYGPFTRTPYDMLDNMLGQPHTLRLWSRCTGQHNVTGTRKSCSLTFFERMRRYLNGSL